MPKPTTGTLLKRLDRRVGHLDRRVGHLESGVRKLDRRVELVEQKLPFLATKDDLKRFATKEDLKRFATKEELKEESERTRHYMKVLIETVHEKIDRLYDLHLANTRRLDEHEASHADHDAKIGGLDLRVTALEQRPSRA